MNPRIPAPYVVSKRLGTFLRLTNSGTIVTVKGRAVKFWNFEHHDFYIYWTDIEDWEVCEKTSGMRISKEEDEQSALVAAFLKLLQNRECTDQVIAANQMPKQRTKR